MFLYTTLLKFPIPAGNIYGLFALVRWKRATFKGKCRNIFPTRSIWVWIDVHTEILESVLLIYTIATFGVLSVWLFLDGKGWVQQKIQMDCTHTFEFEATQLAIGQGNMFCRSPRLQFFIETFALGSFFVFTTWIVHDANAKNQDKQSYRACVSIISDWNTVLHITQRNDTTYQGIRDGKIPAGKFIVLINQMRFIMKCIAYFGKMHNNAKDAELYKQKSLPGHSPNTCIQN